MYDIDPSIVGSPEHSTVTHVARRTAEDCHWFLVAVEDAWTEGYHAGRKGGRNA